MRAAGRRRMSLDIHYLKSVNLIQTRRHTTLIYYVFDLVWACRLPISLQRHIETESAVNSSFE